MSPTNSLSTHITICESYTCQEVTDDKLEHHQYQDVRNKEDHEGCEIGTNTIHSSSILLVENLRM